MAGEMEYGSAEVEWPIFIYIHSYLMDAVVICLGIGNHSKLGRNGLIDFGAVEDYI